MAVAKSQQSQRSRYFRLVKRNYERGLWTTEQVETAVGKWITEAERDEILGGDGE